MASPKIPASRPAPSIANAAQRTRSAIEGLQSRLMEAAQSAESASDPAARADASESEDELERQLEAYFSEQPKEHRPDSAHQHARFLDDLQTRVVERVADRIFAKWEQDRPGTWRQLREQVLEQLVKRVLRQLQSESEL